MPGARQSTKEYAVRLLPVLILTLFLFGCKSETPVSPSSFVWGEYVGTFAITYNVGTDSATLIKSSAVFTFFPPNRYSCHGKDSLNPPSGGGIYRIQGDSMYLTDSITHMDHSDPTLILGGSFFFRSRPDSIIMIQNDAQRRRYRYVNLAVIELSMRPNQSLKLTERAVDDFAAREFAGNDMISRYVRAMNYMELTVRRRSLAPVR